MKFKRDSNHQEIKQALIDAHISVFDSADVPSFVDIVAGGMHQKWGIPITVLIEVKPEGIGLRESQTEFHESWRGAIELVHNRKEALAIFGIDID